MISKQKYDAVIHQILQQDFNSEAYIQNTQRQIARYARRKRILDLIVAPICLVIFAPLYLLAALAILIEDGRPIHFVQVRAGKDGEPFNCLKLRSMIKDAEGASGPQWAQKNDPRVTRVGRVLRKTRLDEVPQFFNVIMGDMSLVGPRPMRSIFIDRIAQSNDIYHLRKMIKPGVTGPSQLFTKAADTVDDHLKKMEYDLAYPYLASVRQDLLLIYRTVFDMLLARGRA